MLLGDKVVFIKAAPKSDDEGPGTLMPRVILGGRLMGLFSGVSVGNDSSVADGLRPVLKLERLLFHKGDEILTMTEDEFDKLLSDHHKETEDGIRSLLSRVKSGELDVEHATLLLFALVCRGEMNWQTRERP